MHDHEHVRAARGLPLAAILTASFLMVSTSIARADDASTCVTAAEQAEKLRSAAHFRAAREQLLVCVDQKCPLIVRRDCTRWLSDVDAQIPSLVFRAQRVDGTDVTDVRVYVDGRQVAAQLNGRAVPVDPGEHAVRFVLPAADGGGFIDSQVLVAEGEQHRVLKLSVAQASHEGDATGGTSSVLLRPEQASRPVPALTWGLGAVAVAGGIGFASLLVAGKSDYDSLETGCGRTRSCTSGQVEGVRLYSIGADVSLGVGVLALGGALWSWAVRPSVAAPVPALSLAPLPGGAMAGWSHSF